MWWVTASAFGSVAAIIPSLAIAEMIMNIQVNRMRAILEKEGAPENFFRPIQEWESKPFIIRLFTNPSWSSKSTVHFKN